MFETISKGFRSVKHRFQGKRELTEENIDDALREIRVSLLEADVDFKVVRQFIGEVKTKALGRIVTVVAKKSGKRSQRVILHQDLPDELEALMGPVDTSFIATV